MLRGQTGGLNLFNDTQIEKMVNGSITIEYRILDPKKITLDLIDHIRTRYTLGSIIIVTDNPHTFLSTFRKQWMREIALLQRERASTLDAVRIVKLSQDLLAMELLRFDAVGGGQAAVNIHIIAPEQLGELPKNCATIYVYSSQRLPWELIHSAITRDVAIVEYSHPEAVVAKTS